jgi:hypothetical protein
MTFLVSLVTVMVLLVCVRNLVKYEQLLNKGNALSFAIIFLIMFNLITFIFGMPYRGPVLLSSIVLIMIYGLLVRRIINKIWDNDRAVVVYR